MPMTPELKKIWWIAFLVQVTFGFTIGLYLFTWGPYFYESFGGTANASSAILFTTILLAVRQGLVTLLELPTGALADTMGRAHTVVLSWGVRVLFFISLVAIWVADSVGGKFAWSLIASIAFSLSYTMFNGSFSAWCVDSLKERAPDVTYTWLVSRFYGYRSIAETVGGLLAIWLYLKNLSYVGFSLAAVISFVCMGYLMGKMEEVKSLKFIGHTGANIAGIIKKMGEIIGKSTQTCARTPVLFWIILSYASFMFLLNLVDYLWPVYIQSQSGITKEFGRDWVLIMVAGQALMTVSSRFLAWINDRWVKNGGITKHMIGLRRLYVLTSIASALAVIVLSWMTAYNSVTIFVFAACVVAVQFSFGIVGPCFESLVNHYVPAESAGERATIMSAGSMLRSFLILLLAIPSGGKSGQTTATGWFIPATLLLFSVVLAAVYMRRTEKTPAPAVCSAIPAPADAGQISLGL